MLQIISTEKAKAYNSGTKDELKSKSFIADIEWRPRENNKTIIDSAMNCYISKDDIGKKKLAIDLITVEDYTYLSEEKKYPEGSEKAGQPYQDIINGKRDKHFQKRINPIKTNGETATLALVEDYYKKALEKFGFEVKQITK